MLCVTKYFVNRISIWTLLLTLLAGLGACRDTVIRPNPDRVLEFEICQEALSTLPKRGAYQGRDGWFYFNHDFWGEYPNLQETDFIVRVKQALETQGVALVLVPLPGVGMSNPEFLYRDDPWQKAFSPAQAQADYRAYVNTLRGQGVEVVDALAAMQAYDAAGGQTFFKRDVHWTPDGANAVAQEIAKSVRRVVTTALPTSAIKLSRALPDKPFYGKHINSWTSEYCGHRLPAEPLRNYTVQSSSEDTRAEVIQAGSSFSVPPFDVGFLAVALQSPVFNASIGGGGAVFPLETYLRGDLYEARRPKVIVWEFPISVHHIIEPQQRRMVAAVYGVCSGADVRFQKTYRLEGNGAIGAKLPSLASSNHYLSFSFSDLKVVKFDVVLRYQGTKMETLSINHPDTEISINRGRFFTMFAPDASLLGEFELITPEIATGAVTVQVCSVPTL